MKIKILVGLFLFAAFYTGSAFAQKETKPQKIFGDGLKVSELYSEFVKINNLDLPKSKCSFDSCVWESEENAKRFFRLFAPLLSRRGSIEVDSRTNTLVITDVKNRVKLLTEYAKLLDGSGLTTEELISSQIEQNKE